MTNTHFVDDDVHPPTADVEVDPKAWPLDALATAPMPPTDAHPAPPRQRRYRSVYPHEERMVPRLPPVDVRDDQAWG